jgi:two-component system response regulator HydG
MHYDYPGNVRELRNVLERASLLSDGNEIQPTHLPEEVQGTHENVGSGETALPLKSSSLTLSALEASTLSERLAQHRGNRKSLATELGISERTLYRKLRGLRCQ